MKTNHFCTYRNLHYHHLLNTVKAFAIESKSLLKHQDIFYGPLITDRYVVRKVLGGALQIVVMPVQKSKCLLQGIPKRKRFIKYRLYIQKNRWLVLSTSNNSKLFVVIVGNLFIRAPEQKRLVVHCANSVVADIWRNRRLIIRTDSHCTGWNVCMLLNYYNMYRAV